MNIQQLKQQIEANLLVPHILLTSAPVLVNGRAYTGEVLTGKVNLAGEYFYVLIPVNSIEENLKKNVVNDRVFPVSMPRKIVRPQTPPCTTCGGSGHANYGAPIKKNSIIRKD